MRLGQFLVKIATLCTSVILTSGTGFAQSLQEIEEHSKNTGRAQTKLSTLAAQASRLEITGEFAKACSAYHTLGELYKAEASIGPDSPRYAWSLLKEAFCLKVLGKKNEASQLAKRGLKIVDGMTEEEYPEDALILFKVNNTARAVLGSDMPPPGEPRMRSIDLRGLDTIITNLPEEESKAIEQLKVVEYLGEGSVPYQRAALYLANIFTLEEKYSEAEALFLKVIANIEIISGKSSKALLRPLSHYGFMLKSANREEEAKNVLKRMMQINTSTKAA